MEDVEGMFLNPVDRSGVHIAGETNFQWNAFIQHILRERPHAENLPVLDLHVLNQTRRVADPVRPAPLDGLPYGFLAEGFARVNRNVEVFPLDVVKRIDVFLRRVSSLFTRQIKPDNSMRPEIDRALCDLPRRLRRHAPHRAKNESVLNAKVLTAAVEPSKD